MEKVVVLIERDTPCISICNVTTILKKETRKVHNIICCRRCRRHRLQQSVAAFLDSLILLRFVVVSVVLVPHVVLLGKLLVLEEEFEQL